MTELEQLKKVYGLCTTMADREWLEEGFSLLEKVDPRSLPQADKALLGLIKSGMPDGNGGIMITGARYHHLARYLKIIIPDKKIDTWPTLKMMSEYCGDNTSVVFTEEWDELHNVRKQFWKKGTVVWLLYREEDNVKVWNKLIYEGFIPEIKTVYRLDSRNEYIMRAVYAPVEISHRDGERRSVYKKVYAFSPAGVRTGGPELMHQFIYHLNMCGVDAYMVYIESGNPDEVAHCHPEYVKYVCGRISRLEDIEICGENAIVVPEVMPVLMEYKVIKKFFWWLSVDNFIKSLGNDSDKLRQAESNVVKGADIMLYQSEYARRYALSIGADTDKLKHLGDYLNSVYIENSEKFLTAPKEKIVAYNPKKGWDFTKKLLEAGPDITWVPIQNMSTEEVRDLLCRARVYIDFGEHPGKDRIPREAAMCGCCIITGRKGSAAFKEDVNIPDRYRIDEEKVSIEEILALIRNLLDDYYARIEDYRDYRNGILEEKEEFIRELKEIFLYKG